MSPPTPTTRTPCRRRRRRGLTTLELLVALAITTITGLGVMTVIISVGRSIEGMNATRGAIQRASTAHHRVRSYTETALCLLASDSRGLAVWLHDDNDNNRVNVSELRVFWYDEEAGEVVVEHVEYPEEMDPIGQTKYDIVLVSADDPFVIMEAQRALGFTSSNVLADGVAALTARHPTKDPRDAPRFQIQIDFRSLGETTEEILLAVGLSQHRRPD